MDGLEVLSTKIEKGLCCLFGKHVNMGPASVVGPTLKKGNIKWTVLFTNQFKSLKVAGVSTEK